MSIEKLTPDFYYSTGINASCGPNNSPLFQEYFIEAPAFFERNGIYYLLFGHCCCFCYQGSGILVHTAKSPLGPWTVQPGPDIACDPPSDTTTNTNQPNTKFIINRKSDINLITNSSMDNLNEVGAIPTPGQGCLYNNSPDISVTRSQQNYVIKVETKSGTQYVWTGDRWQQAPDGIKGHEPQFWVPLNFQANGDIEPVKWVDEFTLDL
jgi:hypothetical protein